MRVPSSPESVLLVGPTSPRDVAGLLTGRDRERAAQIAGYRGVPVSELAKALVAAGLVVEVATTAREVDAAVALEGDRFRLHLVPMRPRARERALSRFRAEREWLGRAIEASEARVVHAHWTYEFAWAALDSGRPTVVTAHDAPLTVLRHYRDAYRAIRTAMAYIVRTRIGTLTAVSPYLAGRWRREMGYRRPIAIVPNVAPGLPARPDGAPSRGPIRLVDVTGPDRLKNVATLAQAFRLLCDTRPGLYLDLVGPGLGHDDPLPRKLVREGLARGVTFHGTLDREGLAGVLAAGTVFVHPSREECCSTAVLEAMHAGLPVVAGRRAGGTPWMLAEGDAGLLVDVENPAAIARAVALLVDDDELAGRLRERARRRVAEAFSPDAVATAYRDVYERALARAA